MPQEPRAKPPSFAWEPYLPAIAVTSVSFLALGVWAGLRGGVKRAVEESSPPEGGAAARGGKPPPVPTLREAMRVRVGGAGGASSVAAGELAARAFLYGTLLCGAGATAAALLISATLGVRDLSGFSEKMRELMPYVRSSFEGGLAPALDATARGGAAAARGAEATVGRAVKAIVPPITSKGRDGADRDELAGLSAKERRAVREWLSWVEGKEDVAGISEGADMPPTRSPADGAAV